MSTLFKNQELEGDDQLAADIKNLSEKERKELLASSESILSTEDASESGASQRFNPSKTLHINAHGIGVIRFPIPSSELEIPVQNADGSLAYMSTRERMRSGNAVLSAPNRGDLVASFYRWGPGRDPTIVMLKEPDEHNEVKVSGKWTSRSQNFKYNAASVSFEWHYKRERREVMVGDEKKSKKTNLLTLEVHGAEKDDVTRVAELVRGDETRTPGTKSCSAGNGGELLIDEMIAKGLGIPEELIVSSCIMMLKKEIDRRRTIQIMVLSAAAS
jgi:hypothetical protein